MSSDSLSRYDSIWLIGGSTGVRAVLTLVGVVVVVPFYSRSLFEHKGRDSSALSSRVK